ncbi:MFS transporter [Croceicoccus sp. BE223]|uniref:MFS transporter n=1 Tax=Croceicoccus sp. BE223 TaxID=2817716 RepID=UPI00285C1793|nr:MFS transporter [Croceicoccus sp. BE223]MDR7101846.1 MFS family permease [Croceicoccus sp. BE223]
MTVHIEAESGEDPLHASPGTIRRPAIFAPLFAPFGVSSGYVSVTLAYLLGEAGLSVAIIATLIAVNAWPQTVKMLWAPFVDTIGNPKVWYAIGAFSVGLCILAMSVMPKTEAQVPIFMALIVIMSVTSTFVSMSAEIFMANQVPAAMRGRASGWSQAGNLGGAGLGGGVGLLLAENLAQPWISGVVIAAFCIACWFATLGLPRFVRTTAARSYAGELKEVAVNVWEVARSRVGYLALLIMLLPIGSGGVPWSAIAGEWGAGGNTVAIVNGLAGGLAAVVGALLAGFICDRMELKRAYSMFGILVGLVAVALIFVPRTPIVFAIGVLAYQMMVGMAYTGYAAIVLEAIGKKSAATNFNLMAALSNIPIAVMSMVDGYMHDNFGTDAMLLGELAFPAAAIVLFWIFVAATAKRGRAAARPA